MNQIMTYSEWLNEIETGLKEMNVDLADCQAVKPYNFEADYASGLSWREAAERALTFWF